MTQEAIQITETPPLPGLKLVQDLNKALQTLGTDFAGPDDPAALAGPFMTWADTGNMLLKRRNEANTDWVVEGTLLVRSAKATGDDLTGPYTFDTRPTYAGATPWDSANFNPANYAIVNPGRGDIGSYGIMYYTSGTVNMDGGAVTPGTSLRYSLFDASAFDGSGPAGSWRLMGRTIASSAPANSIQRVGLFIRIA